MFVSTRLILNSLTGAVFQYIFRSPIERICLAEEFLILAPQSFQLASDALAAWKRQKGITTKVLTIDDGSGGFRTREQIRQMIDDEYDHCLVAPSYVLLLGDAGVIAPFYVNGIATDYPYSVYPHAGGGSGLPDFAIGRVPVTSLEQANTVVHKIIDYESSPVNDLSFYGNMTIASYFQAEDVETFRDKRTYLHPHFRVRSRRHAGARLPCAAHLYPRRRAIVRHSLAVRQRHRSACRSRTRQRFCLGRGHAGPGSSASRASCAAAPAVPTWCRSASSSAASGTILGRHLCATLRSQVLCVMIVNLDESGSRVYASTLEKDAPGPGGRRSRGRARRGGPLRVPLVGTQLVAGAATPHGPVRRWPRQHRMGGYGPCGSVRAGAGAATRAGHLDLVSGAAL